MEDTTKVGYRNRNDQVVVQQTMERGTDQGQLIYALRCSKCGLHYGANGSDVFQRKCPICQGGAPGLHIPTVLLTYSKWTWDDMPNAIAQTASGNAYPATWTVNAHKQVRPGHRAFVLKQGKEQAGIVAAGYVRSGPHRLPHWDPNRDELVNKFEIDLEDVVSPANGIPRTELRSGALASVNWDILGSGKILLGEAAAEELERLWARHLSQLRSAPTISVSFDSLTIGEQYDRPELAAMWGYHGWQAISRGCVTPASHRCIILFITREKQKALTQYAYHFDGDHLYMEGETNHAADLRIANARVAGDEIHLFFRDTHHAPFTYFGEIHVVGPPELRTDSPSRFVFETNRTEALADSALRAEDRTHGMDDDVDPGNAPDAEGRSRLTTHVRYERSAKNRALAIKLHGTICKVCGFDFNAVYGADLARDFINVHHTRPVTELNDSAPDIETELVPVCANCHMMAHREPGRIVPISELRERVRERRVERTPGV